jgi:hypothetical protein
MNRHFNVPWSAVRKFIHIGYDYVQEEPSQYDFISQIPSSDLKELYNHAILRRHYGDEFIDAPYDWSELIKLLMTELEYREE